jgi:uncharacterized membrane protein YGL010W
VIILFQDVSGWKSLKMMRDLWQGQKRISFYDDVMQVLSIAPPFFFFFSSFDLGLVNHPSIRALNETAK